jgi:hypothetical protein
MTDTRNHNPAPMPSAVINLYTSPSNGLSSPDSLVNQFISLRGQSLRREQSLAAALTQIRAALKDNPGHQSPPVVPAPPPHSASQRTGLTAAVADALAQGPLAKEQILEKLRGQGFPLPSNPRRAVDPVLYNKKRCRREGKLFSLVLKAAEECSVIPLTFTSGQTHRSPESANSARHPAPCPTPPQPSHKEPG